MNTIRHLVTRLVPAALAALLLLPQSAAAAPNRVTFYDIRNVGASAGTRGFLVGAELASTVQLPAELKVAVPKGAEVNWVGEILGGDPSKDPTAKYRTEPGGAGYDVIVMTLTQARRGQAELSLPASGGDGSLSVSWPVPEAADAAQIAIEVPTGSQVSSATSGAQAIQTAGSTFYLRQVSPVAKGQLLELSVALTAASGQQQAPQQPVPQQQAPPQQAAPPVSAQAQGGGRRPASPVAVVGVLAAILFATFWGLERVRPQPSNERH